MELRADRNIVEVILSAGFDLCVVFGLSFDRVLSHVSSHSFSLMISLVWQVAVRLDWRALEYASDELREDKPMVMLAITGHRQEGHKALQHVLGVALDDPDIIFAAVKQHGTKPRPSPNSAHDPVCHK